MKEITINTKKTHLNAIRSSKIGFSKRIQKFST